MNYTVVWLPAAEAQLAALWTVSTRQSDVTRAAAAIDRRLAVNGAKEGESRPNGRRIAFEPPVAVIFDVDDRTRTVRVGRVWEFA